MYLFGSHARGDAGPDSDYDLLVVVPESSDPPFRRAQRAHQILWGVPAAADIFVMTRTEFDSQRDWVVSVPRIVVEEGTELYAA